MERGLRPRVVERERLARLVGVDRFVLGAVVLKYAIDFGNTANRQHVPDDDHELGAARQQLKLRASHVEAEPEEEGELSPEVFGIGADEVEAEVVEEEPRRVVPAPLPIEVDDEEEDTGASVALSRTDPLARYMQEVSRHPVLSREEEHRLAVRYTQTGDLDAAYRLVASNLRLVVKIAYEYRRAAFNVLDLIQEGNVGLMKAVKRFDPERGVRLVSFAVHWIRAEIHEYILRNWRVVKIATTKAQRKLFFNLRSMKKSHGTLTREETEPVVAAIVERLRDEFGAELRTG